MKNREIGKVRVKVRVRSVKGDVVVVDLPSQNF